MELNYRVCPICGITFTPTTHNQRICVNPECKKKNAAIKEFERTERKINEVIARRTKSSAMTRRRVQRREVTCDWLHGKRIEIPQYNRSRHSLEDWGRKPAYMDWSEYEERKWAGNL